MSTIDRIVAENYLKDPNSVSLSDFDSINLEGAEVLAQFTGYELRFGHLEPLDEAVAAAIARAEVRHIDFAMLKSMSLEVAVALSHSHADIYLHFLSDASYETLEQLASGTAKITIGEEGPTHHKFAHFLAESPRIAAAKAKILNDELQLATQERATGRSYTKEAERAIGEIERLQDTCYSSKIGFLWQFFGGYPNYKARSVETEYRTGSLIAELLPYIQSIQERRTWVTSRTYRDELQKLEHRYWCAIASLVRIRSFALIQLLKFATEREHSLAEKIIRRQEAVNDIRKALSELTSFLDVERLHNISRGTIMNVLSKLPNNWTPTDESESRRDYFAKLLIDPWTETHDQIAIPLARAVDRLRSAGFETEATAYYNKLSKPIAVA